MSKSDWDWLQEGSGEAPALTWSFSTDAPLIGLAFAQETQETLLTDKSGGLYRLNPQGRVKSVNRGFHWNGPFTWSQTGNGGAGAIDSSHLVHFQPDGSIDWIIDLAIEILAISMESSGEYIAASLSNGKVMIITAGKDLIGQFEVPQPFSHLQLLNGYKAIIGISRFGHFGAYDLEGGYHWEDTLSCQVGELAVCGNSEKLLVAGNNYGIRIYTRRGAGQGSILVDGTPHRIGIGYFPKTFAAATVEQQLYWLNFDGQLLWASQAPEAIRHLTCDARGRSVLCGFRNGRVGRLTFGD